MAGKGNGVAGSGLHASQTMFIKARVSVNNEDATRSQMPANAAASLEVTWQDLFLPTGIHQ